MLIEPQRLLAYTTSQPEPLDGGRAIDCLCMDSPAYQLLQQIGRVFELEGRHWTVRQFFLPLTQDQTVRSGVRALVADEHRTVGFVNQRDLELLLGLHQPKGWCSWLGEAYPYMDDIYGVCCDAADLLDELHQHELERRRLYGGTLPNGLEYVREIHREQGVDVRQLLSLLWDADPQTGMSPDYRLSTIENRWVRVEEERIQRR